MQTVLLLVVAVLSAMLGSSAAAAAEPLPLPSPRPLAPVIAAWQPVASDGVEVALAADPAVPGPDGAPSLRIDFNFVRGAGHCGAVLPIDLDLPPNFALDLAIRGSGPANNLELKLADAANQNVHWVNRRAFEWPAEWDTLRNQRRHFRFAWGPNPERPLGRIGRVEVIIASAAGGRGSVWLSGLTLRTLPAAQPFSVQGIATASSALDAAHLPDGVSEPADKAGEGWRAARSDLAPALTLDLMLPFEIGGLAIQWPRKPPIRPESLRVETSDDGAAWALLTRVARPLGAETWLPLPGTQARYLRLSLTPHAGAAPAPLGIRRVEIMRPELGESPNAWWAERARRAPRGHYPRTLLGEQSYWTVVGVPDDDREALINEEGQIEIDNRSCSLEPFLLIDGRVHSWADARHTQSLRDGWIPIPTVERVHDAGLTLRTTALVAGAGGASCLYPSYVVRNTSERVQRGQLAVAIRPFQVLPPWQDLNITGGFTPVRSIEATERGILVNGRIAIVPAQLNEFTAVSGDNGDVVELLAAGALPTTGSATCDRGGSGGGAGGGRGGASGVILFDWELKPGESATYFLCVPLHGTALPAAPAALPTTTQDYERLAAATAVAWRTVVNRVALDLPDTPSGRAFSDTIRAQQAYVLINRDGLGFQPGSRTYERSWIRDGALTSAAMLAFGHTRLVREFIDWYAPFQFESGKVPCVVDRRGPDPVPEHDSHGQLITLIATYHRFTGDSTTARRHLPAVRKAVAYMQEIRATRLTPEFSESGPARQEPGKPAVPALAFRGLLPESISHEGYSAKPMHSYWDDFFALRGLADAAYLADALGEKSLAAEWQALITDFRASLVASIAAAQRAHGIDYIPGCVELGDFDSTSTTVALWPLADAAALNARGGLPGRWLTATFERAWGEFTRRRDDPAHPWEAYTPYELRHVGAYLRLGRPERAWASLQWFMGHQRPAGWRHWAEVVWRDPLAPKMIGDMPHTWCGSDFLSAARSLFVFERDGAGQVVVAAGLPDEWTGHPSGIWARDLPTMFGPLSLRIRPGANGTRIIELSGAAKPPAGFALRLPAARTWARATVNASAASLSDAGEVIISTLPAEVVLTPER